METSKARAADDRTVRAVRLLADTVQAAVGHNSAIYETEAAAQMAECLGSSFGLAAATPILSLRRGDVLVLDDRGCGDSVDSLREQLSKVGVDVALIPKDSLVGILRMNAGDDAAAGTASSDT